uniref:Maestro heat-like repeat-containing protein family member 1 n=2 Tax=Cacopsylla melanoneura TaxID=428564 RepID=A0A8D8WXD3_9HEMI
MEDMNKSSDSPMLNSVYKFFYDENKNNSKTVVPPDMTTVIDNLVESAWSDKDDLVRDTISDALLQLSTPFSQLILQSIINFRKSHSKLTQTQVNSMLKAVEQICRKQPGDLLPPLLNQVIAFSLEELLRAPQDPLPASAILVALGQNHCNNVMEVLLPRLLAGGDSLPNVSLIYTVGHLCSVVEFMPHISTVLDTIVTMLPAVKSDDHKFAFSYAFGKLCEAVSEHLSACKDKPDSGSVSKETYSRHLGEAFNTLFLSWMNNKDNKVCEAVLKALAPMFDLLPTHILTQNLPSIVSSLLALYKRAPALPRHSVTSALASLLHVAPVTSIEAHIDLIICTLHPMVWAVVDYNAGHPTYFRNHNEALRCYGEIAINFSARLDEILLRHLSIGTEQDKIISLVICTHLLSNKIVLRELLPVVHQLVNEPSAKLRKVLVKIIVELAYRNHITGTDSILIEFLVKNCSLQGDGSAEWVDLQETCQRTVFGLCTTVPPSLEVFFPNLQVQALLWNVLLRMLVTPEIPAAIPTITKSLAYLASECKFTSESGQEGIERSKQVNSKAVLARCLCLLGDPFHDDRGPSLLEFLKLYTSTLHPNLPAILSEKIPPLLDYLKLSDWTSHEWERELRDLTRVILSCMDRDYAISFASQLSVQFYVTCSDTSSDVSERVTLMYCLGETLCLLQDKAIIHSHLDTIINTLRTNSSTSSQTCAKAVGIVARSHLSLVLSRLDTLVKSELTRKSSRLLGLLRDTRQENEIERARLTLLYSYAYVVIEAPPGELAPHISTLCQFLLAQLTVCKEGDGNEACLFAIDNILQSIHQHPSVLTCSLEHKSQFLSLALSQVQSAQGPPRPILLKTIGSILKLPPPLPLPECSNILKITIAKVLQNCDKQTSKQATLHELWSLLEVILDQHAGTSLLMEIMGHLNPWINHTDPGHRSHALSTLHISLVAFYGNVGFHLSDPVKFECIGSVVGSLCVHACETEPGVRLPALRCIQTLLQLALCFEGHLSPDEDLPPVFCELSNESPTDYSTLSYTVCAKLPYPMLGDYAKSLVEGLREGDGAEGVGKMLNLLAESKGAELYHDVNDILDRIFCLVPGETGLLATPTILCLLHHHPSAVLNGLLAQSLPYGPNFVSLWRSLAQSTSVNDILRHLIRCLGGALFVEGKQHHRDPIAAHQPLSAVSALSEMFSEHSLAPTLRAYFPELFSTLLMVLGAYIGAQPPSHTPTNKASSLFIPNRNVMKLVPSLETCRTLRSLLEAVGCTKGSTALEDCKKLEFENKITVLSPCVSPLMKHVIESEDRSCVAKIVTSVNSYPCKTQSQKILVASVRAALICHGTSLDPVLLDSVIDSVLDGLSEANQSILVCSYKALASFAYLDHQQVGRHKDAVLEALVCGIEKYDPESQDVALEAMTGLGLLLPQLPHNTLSPIIIPIAITLKPFFEKENVALRCKALQVFGQLTTFNLSSEKESLREQLLGNLVCFLMYINETNAEVANTCRATLYQSVQLLDDSKMNEAVSKFIAQEMSSTSTQYYDFLSALAEGLVSCVPDSIHTLLMTALNYSKSSQPMVKSNAALFIGLLYHAWDREDALIGSISTRLMSLLKDSHPNVRMKAAQALSLLYVKSDPYQTTPIENSTEVHEENKEETFTSPFK